MRGARVQYQNPMISYGKTAPDQICRRAPTEVHVGLFRGKKARVENAPKMSEANRREGAKRGEAGLKAPHKSGRALVCVRRSRLRETPPWFNKK